MSGGYTPLFASLTTGTLCGRWPDVGLFPILLSLADRHGVVDVTTAYLAVVTGLPLDEVTACLQRFCQPDPYSRSSAEGGARLVLIDPENRNWGWRIVNHGRYRERARKASYDAARTDSGRDRDRKRESRSLRSETRDVPTSPDESRSHSQTETQTVNSNCKNVPAGEPGIGHKSRLHPSDEAIAKAMACRCNILLDDLLANWHTWASHQPGPFRRLDKAFLTWAGKHEPTDAQRNRAIRANRSSNSSVPLAIGETVLLQKERVS
jgi:hypothetical protein